MPTPWTGCAVKQRQAAAAPEPPASFAIFDENVQPPRSARARLGSGLREQVDAIRKCNGGAFDPNAREEVVKGLAAAPPALTFKIGVSASTKSLDSK